MDRLNWRERRKAFHHKEIGLASQGTHCWEKICKANTCNRKASGESIWQGILKDLKRAVMREKLFCETGLLKDRNFKHISQHWVLMKLRPMRPVLFSNSLPSTKHLDSGRAHTTAR